MKRFSECLFTAIAACLLGIAAQGDAKAAITITTVPFTGVLTDFTSVGNQSLPFVDANGRTVSASGLTTEITSNGLYFITSGSGTLTFAGLAAGTTQIGFTFGLEGNYLLNSDMYIASIALDNGNSLLVGPSTTGGFIGFTDTTPFTSATLTMTLNNGWSGFIADFRTFADRQVVPEPGSLGLLGSALALFGVAAVRLKKRSAGDRTE